MQLNDGGIEEISQLIFAIKQWRDRRNQPNHNSNKNSGAIEANSQIIIGIKQWCNRRDHLNH